MKPFEVISDITDIETIAVGSAIRDLVRLRKRYGPGHCRKVKGIAVIHRRIGRIRRADIHWREAHGIGRKEFERKQNLD